MAKNVQLLLLRSVENLGIVGDVVKVKPGFARNFLLPTGLAEPPSAAKIEALKEERARAQAEQSALKSARRKLIEELKGATVAVERTCNDQGALYGSVTQRDISDALIEAGFGVDVRSVRLAHPIRRIGSYHVLIQFDKELRTEITMVVKADRLLEGFTETGDLIEPPPEEVAAEPEPEPEAKAPAPEPEAGAEAKPGKGKKSKKDRKAKAEA